MVGEKELMRDENHVYIVDDSVVMLVALYTTITDFSRAGT